jgi:hypothetical protein
VSASPFFLRPAPPAGALPREISSSHSFFFIAPSTLKLSPAIDFWDRASRRTRRFFLFDLATLDPPRRCVLVLLVWMLSDVDGRWGE